MENLIIRKATEKDLETLLLFEQGVISAERPFDTTLKNDPIRYYDLHKMINATYIELLVAELDNIVVGSGYARIEKSKIFYKHAEYAYLGFMYVRPEYRGKGINRKIIEMLKKWASTQNIDELRLEVYVGNEPAIKAYQKIGFLKHIIEMRLSLGNVE
jgi:ribosomal protein S18 acetylase RimI-like enzyme